MLDLVQHDILLTHCASDDDDFTSSPPKKAKPTAKQQKHPGNKSREKQSGNGSGDTEKTNRCVYNG